MRPILPTRRSPPQAADGAGEALRMVIEALGDPVVTSDAAGQRFVLNRSARELFGATAGGDPWSAWQVSLAGKSAILSPDALPLARVLRGEVLEDVGYVARAPGASARTFRVSGRRMRDHRGRSVGAVLRFRELEDAQREGSAGWPPMLVEHLPVAVSLIRAADGEVVYVNHAWGEMFGYDPREAVGQRVSRLIALAERASAAGSTESARVLDRVGRWHGDVECVHRDGTPMWTATDVWRFEHPEHGALWVAVQTDITAERADRVSRADAAERWGSAFEDAPVGMAIIGPDLRMVDVNAQLCALSGYSRAELIGASLATLAHPDDVALDAELAARLRTGELSRYRVDKRLRRPDGATVPVVITVSLVRAPDSRVLHELAVVAER